ncbi:MAG: hypothetical protein RJA98_2041 [Pseudomonadota bacterium]|jgi:5'-nucleotidase
MPTSRFTLSARPLLTACAAALLASGCALTPDTPQPLTLRVLHINDHHSHLDADTLPLQLPLASGKTESVSADFGGFPRVVSAIQALRASGGPVLAIHAGDAVTGDLYFSLTDGQADAALMNQVCFDSFTLGNHEFDNGDAGLRQFLGFLRSGSCHTPVLSANTRFGEASPLHASRAPGWVQPSTVVTAGGQKIGLVGLTIAGKTMNASRPSPGTVLGDELQAAQAEIDRLTAAGINKIIVQAHTGYDFDLALAKQLRGVDVIVGGDSHTLLGPDTMKGLGLTPAGPYPTRTTDRDGKLVCVVQAWQYSGVVGELSINFDAQGDVSSCSGTPHLLIGDTLRKGKDVLAGADRDAALAAIQQSGVLRVTAPDAAAAAVMAPYLARKTQFGAQVVGRAEAPLCLRRVPGSKLDRSRSTLGDVCNADPSVNARGGDIQQIVAEAFLQGAREFFAADVSIQNGGGVRTDVPAGDVTVKQVYTVLPFKNTLVQLQMSGTELKAALEDALDGVVAKNNSGGYPYTGGLRFAVNLSAAKGQRLSALEVRMANGSYAPIDPARSYRIATTNFLADGQDFYGTLATIKGERRSDVGLDYAEVLLRYLQKQPGQQLRKLPVADYSTQAFVDVN